jgi:hypothetical protein
MAAAAAGATAAKQSRLEAAVARCCTICQDARPQALQVLGSYRLTALHAGTVTRLVSATAQQIPCSTWLQEPLWCWWVCSVAVLLLRQVCAGLREAERMHCFEDGGLSRGLGLVRHGWLCAERQRLQHSHHAVLQGFGWLVQAVSCGRGACLPAKPTFVGCVRLPLPCHRLPQHNPWLACFQEGWAVFNSSQPASCSCWQAAPEGS